MPDHQTSFQISGVDDVINAVEGVFSYINVGLIIYHMTDPNDESKLKLVYANEEASEYTGTDLQTRIGKSILEAFPSLAETELPKVYVEVATKQEARQIGVVEYTDQTMQGGAYAVKAFPMPANCIGVLFEDIAVRKHVDELVQRRTEDLKGECDELAARIASIGPAVIEASSKAVSLSKSLADRIPPKESQDLTEIIETLKEMQRIAD